MAGENEPLRGHRVSDIIDFQKLEHETQRFFFIGLVFAFMIYPVVGSYFMFRKNDNRVAQPFSVKFAIRAARLTKPFELKPSYTSPRIFERLGVFEDGER